MHGQHIVNIVLIISGSTSNESLSTDDNSHRCQRLEKDVNKKGPMSHLRSTVLDSTMMK